MRRGERSGGARRLARLCCVLAVLASPAGRAGSAEDPDYDFPDSLLLQMNYGVTPLWESRVSIFSGIVAGSPILNSVASSAVFGGAGPPLPLVQLDARQPYDSRTLDCTRPVYFLAGPEPVPCSGWGGLDKSLSLEQETFFGCGAIWDTACWFDGIDWSHASKPAVLQSFITQYNELESGRPLSTLRTDNRHLQEWNYNSFGDSQKFALAPAAQKYRFAERRRFQPGTLDFVLATTEQGDPLTTPFCGLVDFATADGVEPGCRWSKLLDESSGNYTDNPAHDLLIDGDAADLGVEPLNSRPFPTDPGGNCLSSDHGNFPDDLCTPVLWTQDPFNGPGHPFTGDEWANEIAAASWNLQVLLVAHSDEFQENLYSLRVWAKTEAPRLGLHEGYYWDALQRAFAYTGSQEAEDALHLDQIPYYRKVGRQVFALEPGRFLENDHCSFITPQFCSSVVREPRPGHCEQQNLGSILEAYSFQPADIDGDGDGDLVASNQSLGNLAWWENVDGKGRFCLAQLMWTSTGVLNSMKIADIDGDDDLDVLVASRDNAIMWFENEEAGTFAPPQIVAQREATYFIEAADIDGDGHSDVAATQMKGHWRDSAWHRHIDGIGNFTSAEAIPLPKAGKAVALDVDHDEDVDFLSTSPYLDPEPEILWLENVDGQGSSWETRTFSENTARTVTVADVDGDDAPDVIAASGARGVIEWYRNPKGGAAWSPTQISADAAEILQVDAGDFDGDLDTDVVASIESRSAVVWGENTEGDGSAWTEHVIGSDSTWAAYAAYVDDDEYLDVVMTSGAWYRNTASNGWARLLPEPGANAPFAEVIVIAVLVTWRRSRGTGDRR